MVESNLLMVIFRLVNFIVIAALGVYVYVRYIAPTIAQLIQKSRQHLKDLQERFNDNNKTIEQLKNNFIIQQATIEDLTTKLKKWQVVNKNQYEQRAQEQAAMIEQVNQKRKKQSDHLSLYNAEQEIMINVLNDVEKSLDKLPQEEKTDYTNKLLHFMETQS